MYKETLHKIINQEWLTLSLLFGFILVIALVSSIPIFTEGVLQRLLISEMETLQVETNDYPGNYSLRGGYTRIEPEDRYQTFYAGDSIIPTELVGRLGLSVQAIKKEFYLGIYKAETLNPRLASEKERTVEFITIPDIDNHITVFSGENYSSTPPDDYLEALVTSGFAEEKQLLVGDTLSILDKEKDEWLKVKIIGLFNYSDTQDLFWDEDIKEYKHSLVFDYSSIEDRFIKGDESLIDTVYWNYALDYHEVKITQIPFLINELVWQNRQAVKYQGSFGISFPLIDVMKGYLILEKDLRLSLWMVLTPVFLLMAFYIFMVSHLMVSSETNEISTLKSRGFSTWKVFKKYLFETLIFVVVALLVGPPMGFGFSKFIGSSAGFLEFVNRPIPEMNLSFKVYIYSAATGLIIFFFRMIPVVLVSRQSIVELKRERARNEKKPFWFKYYLDVVFLLFSGYGLLRFFQQLNLWQGGSDSTTDGSLDPLLFITSTLFMVGVGLLLLRFFPIIIKTVFSIGKKNWSPHIYSSLLHVERNQNESLMLMLFLMVSISTGIYSANTARTLNQNLIDQAYYQQGSDILIIPKWGARAKDTGEGGVSMDQAQQLQRALQNQDSSLNYVEPDFNMYRNLSHVESAARVFRHEEAQIEMFDGIISSIEVLGIDSFEFGQTSWYRSDLFDKAHFFSYLNLLTYQQNAVLVSSAFKKYDLEIGDEVLLTWDNQEPKTVVIYEFIDNWPTFDPNEQTLSGADPLLIVANLNFLQGVFSKRPYEVWLKMDDLSNSQALYDEIESSDIRFKEIHNIYDIMIEQRNDPLLQGLNGVLTQGFIVIILLCFIGFLLFRVVSLFTRSLQFGIFRAIGMTKKQLMDMILLEQLLTFGTAIFLGIILGSLTSKIFIPFLQIFFRFSATAPEFMVISNGGDYIKIYAVIILLLGLGYFTIRLFIKKLNIGAALKLGED